VERAGGLEPDVMVPAEPSRAVARYLDLVRRGALNTSALVSSDETGSTVPSELVIPPLLVGDLAVAGMETENGPELASR
jgi:hypothetical protein